MTSRHDQQPRDNHATLESPPATSFLTRSNVNQQRVSHSCRRASRSFQIRSPTSLTLVSTNLALVPDSQLTVAITRGQATTVLSEAPQQGAKEKNSTALRYHVCRVPVSNVQHTFLDNCGKGCGSHIIKYAQSVKLKAMCNVQVWRVDGLAQTLLLTRVAKTTSTC